jgi:hypothetical protein
LQDSEAFYGRLTHRLEQQYTMDEGALKKELDVLVKRNQEIDEMFMSLYADKTKGILTEQRFFRMTETLEQEQADNKARMQTITDELRTASDTGPAAAPRPSRSDQTLAQKSEREDNARWKLPLGSIGVICPTKMPPPLMSFG